MKLLVYTREMKHLSKGMQNYIVNNFDGLYVECIAPESIDLAKRFDPIECLLDTGTPEYLESVALNPDISNKYIDEPFSSTDFDKMEAFKVGKQINLYGYNLTIGELSSKAFNTLKDFPCCVTFTAYRRYIKWIEKLFSWRIYIPFTSPLSHWKDLQNEFGSKFNMVWVHLTKNNCHKDKLINWASAYGKDIYIYAGIGTWENETELKNYLDKWINKR